MKKGWQTKRLGDVLEVQNGYAFDSVGFNPTKGMPLIRIRSLKPGTETETRFDGDYDKKYVVKAGDLLIGMDGEFGCYEWKGEPALLNQRVCRLQGFSGELVPKFLFYGVNDYLKAIEDVTGYATVKHLSSKQILAIGFPVPPLAEQQRIVQILDEAFEGIAAAKANAEQNLRNARTLFESHLQSVFTQRGKGWVEKALGETCEVVNGGTPKTGVPGYWDGNHRWITPAEMGKRLSPYVSETERMISDLGLRNSSARLLPPHSVILSSRAPIGHLVINAEPMATNQGCKGLIPRSQLQHKFLYYYLSSIVGLLNSLGTGATFKELSGGKLKEVPVAVAPLPVQQEIVAKLDSLREETQRLAHLYERKLAALAALKKSLLHQAFTGNL